MEATIDGRTFIGPVTRTCFWLRRPHWDRGLVMCGKEWHSGQMVTRKPQLVDCPDCIGHMEREERDMEAAGLTVYWRAS